MVVKKKNVSEDDRVSCLLAEKKELEVRLNHLENDFSVTQDEFENTTKSYLEILSNLEKVVNERTKKIKEMGKVLEVQSRELQAMLDAVPAILYYKDRDIRYNRVNRMFCDVFRYPRDVVMGKTDEELFPDGTGFASAADAKVLKTGKPLLKRKENISTPDGNHTYRISRIPYRNEKKIIIGIIGFALQLEKIT